MLKRLCIALVSGIIAMAAFAPGATADPKKGATFSDTVTTGRRSNSPSTGTGTSRLVTCTFDFSRTGPDGTLRGFGTLVAFITPAKWRVPGWRVAGLAQPATCCRRSQLRNATSRAAMPLRLHAPYPTLETPQSRAMTTEVRSAAHEFVSEWTARQVEAHMRPG